MSKIPDDMKTGEHGEYWQALAENYEAKFGKEIEWTGSGPVCGTLNLSYMFMYPPIIDVQKFTDELNDNTSKLKEKKMIEGVLDGIIDYPSLFAWYKSNHVSDYNLDELAEMARDANIKIVSDKSII